MQLNLKTVAGMFGTGAVSVFLLGFLVFSALNPEFDVLNDYISKLGARGQQNAAYWNLIGFAIVGGSLAIFGWLFGLASGDRILGGLLFVAGIGFAVAAVPTDFADPDSQPSKIHYASICFGLAGWCLGMARLIGSKTADGVLQKTAKYAVSLGFLPFLAAGAGVFTEPISHRALLLVIFTWVSFTSLRLLRSDFATPRRY